jgi:hypothetical protein
VKIRLALIATLLSLGGCSIEQKIKPITIAGVEPREICIIENPAVHEDFLDVYKRALAQKGLMVRLLPEGTEVNACPLTSTYTARWQWDLALYLTFTDLRVYRNGRLAGEAVYDAQNGAANISKFIDAKTKIQELTSQLVLS